MVIVGGGIAGVLAGAHLRKAGIERIRIIDQAGGIGGTWYWNRYPGVMCDVESYIYMPMLEELDYIPTRRYAFGEEILQPPPGDRRPVRPGGRRPVPHRGDPRRVARGRGPVADPHRPGRRGQLPLVRAGRRHPQPDEAARHPGHGGLRRTLVPHGPLGLRVHRRRARDEPLTGLADKVVALIGTGASGIQCVPPLAESAKHLYVFQRTPSAIGERGNRPTDPDFAAGSSRDGSGTAWTTSRRSCMGRPVEVDLVDDGWTHHYAAVQHPPARPRA